jgi:hypothetical protein
LQSPSGRIYYVRPMAKFLINNLSEDGLTGETDQVETILHNLMIIGQPYKDGFLKQVEESRLPWIVQICVCGRFVTYIEMNKDMKEGLMQFFDLKNDNDLALDAAAEIQNRWYGSTYFNWFMEEFSRLKDVYSDNYPAAELFLSENAGVVLN